MKIYTLSPQGVPENPHLFPTMRPTFISQGHSFVGIIEDSELVMLDLHTRISDYNSSDIFWILQNQVPVVTFDEWDRGGMSSDVWPNPLTEQQRLIFDRISNNKIKSVHFCRLLDKTKTYPFNLFPFEKPILHEELLATPDELFNRPIDVFFVANSAPNREKIKQVFDEDKRFKCNIVLGAAKIPFNEWLSKCMQSKFFIKASGGGYSCERMQALFSISPMILERTDQLLANPFTHLENCIEISNPPTKEDLDILFQIINNKEELYRIYKNGYDFMKGNYTQEAISLYILNKIKNCL